MKHESGCYFPEDDPATCGDCRGIRVCRGAVVVGLGAIMVGVPFVAWLALGGGF